MTGNETEMSRRISRLVSTREDNLILEPLLVGRGSMQNELLLFVKPEVFLLKHRSAIEETLRMILKKLEEFQARPAGISVVGGDVLDRLGIMNKHYGLINRLSRHASQMLTPEDMASINDAIGESADGYEILGGHQFARAVSR